MPTAPRTPPDDRLAALLARRDDGIHDEEADLGDADVYDGAGRWVPRPDPDPRAATPDRRGRRDRRGPHDPRAPAPLTAPETLRGARVQPGAWAIVGVVVLLALAVAVFGLRTWHAQSTSRPTPVGAESADDSGRSPGSRATSRPSGGGSADPSSPGGPGAGGRSGAPTTAAPATASAPVSATPGPVVVHVAGAVRRPGVVTLPSGSRVVDAVERCGGPLPSGDLTTVNLARPVADGEQIVVTVRGQAPPAPQATAPGAPPAPSPGAGRGPVGSGAAAPGGPVDLNSADVAALDTLPGVGPVLAQRIVDYRAQNGRFASVEQLGEVEGVGDKTLERLGPLVRV